MNSGGLLEDFDYAVNTSPLPWYLLISKNRVIDVQDNPVHLAFDEVPVKTSFTVAVGITNEFGKKEIVGTVADYAYNEGSTVSWIKSPVDSDGPYRPYALVKNPAEFIKERLRLMMRMRVISDPCNLKQVIVIDGRLVNEELPF